MNDFKLTTPVAFIVFNRPDTTARVFAEIARARPPKLLVVGDGARAGRLGEEKKVAEARAIIEKVDWDCEVRTNFSEINLGCKKRVSSGIDWIFEMVDEAIILEDDCLPDPSFFRFCQEMLIRYRYDERILMVSGTNLAWDISQESDYYFSRYPHIWGWASWRRAWKDYDVSMQSLPVLLRDDSFINSFQSKREYYFWVDTFKSVHAGQVNSWDAQVVYLAFTKSQLTVFPSGNLISNIGFGQDATHTIRPNKLLANLPFKGFPPTKDVRSPIFMIVNKLAEMQRKRKEGIGVNKYLNYLKLAINSK
jgi:hypothetical protein